jgi:hypothetical protein
MAARHLLQGCRSLNGCWTCRLRRKKCDENRPSCTRCVSLELECHGYGPKPEWMDRGAREKEKALKFKNLIHETKSRRRQGRLQLSSPVAISSSLPNFPDGTADLYGDSGIVNEPLWYGSVHNTVLPVESFFNQNDGTPVPCQHLPHTITGTQKANIEPNSVSSESPEWTFESQFHPSSECDDHDLSGTEVSRFVQIEPSVEALIPLREPTTGEYHQRSFISRPLTSDNQADSSSSSSSSYTQNDSSPVSAHVGQRALRPSDPADSIAFRDLEDTLFMHYLDRVFHIQYAFYHATGQHGRGWLFSILTRVKSAYHAAMALSEYHQFSECPRQSNADCIISELDARSTHYDLAVREMRISLAQHHTWSGTLLMARSIETLTCILLLLFWEVRLLRHDSFVKY